MALDLSHNNSMLGLNDSSNNPTLPPVSLFRIFYWSTVSLVTVTTNLTLLLLILCHDKLKTCCNYFSMSLCVVDILFATVYILPRWANPYWQNFPFFCALLPPTGLFFVSIINLHQCTIHLDRCFRFVSPIKYQKLSFKNYVVIVVVVIWIISLLAAYFPIMFLGGTNITHCILTSSNPENDRNYLIAVNCIVFFIPILIIVITYFQVFLIINTRRKTSTSSNSSSFSSITVKKNLKVAKQMLVVTGTFILFWFPFCAVVFVIIFNLFRSPAIWFQILTITQHIAFANPAISPILIVIYNKTLYERLKMKFCPRYYRKKKYSSHMTFHFLTKNVNNGPVSGQSSDLAELRSKKITSISRTQLENDSRDKHDIN